MVSVDNDKPTVLALREIAEGFITASILVEKPGAELEEEAVEQLEAAAATAMAAHDEQIRKEDSPPAEE